MMREKRTPGSAGIFAALEVTAIPCGFGRLPPVCDLLPVFRSALSAVSSAPLAIALVKEIACWRPVVLT